ncbi:TonB-dependent receptor [Puteibacter caeruleilacunae]|nr:TonB-dependent receptor [Puteibacter caeruleilacunae]
MLREKMNYSIALRLDQNSAEADKVDEVFQNMYSDLSPSDFNISASVGATRNWDNNWSLGMWLGRGVRNGGIAERYINHLPIGVDPYEMLGNPDIKPEVNHQLDLSLGWSTENTNLSVGLFGSLLNDYISSTIDPSLTPRMKTAPGVRRFVNIDKATMMGFDIAWHQQWVPQIKSSLSMNYTYGENDDFDEPLPEIAPMEVNVAIEGNFIQNRLFPKVALRHAMEQDRIAETFGEVETPDFTTVDINIRYLITNNISLTGGMSNVFDETYREHLSRYNRSTSQPIYAPGRNAFATLTFNW